MNYIKLPGFFVITLIAVLLLTNSGSAQAPQDTARPNASLLAYNPGAELEQHKKHK